MNAITSIDGDTMIVTSDEKSMELLQHALAVHDPENRIYSSYLDFAGSGGCEHDELKLVDIDRLGTDAQTDITKIKKINQIVRKYINTDDLIGMVVQSIDNNVNTEYHLTWKDFDGKRNKLRMLEKAKQIIEDFNDQINVRQVIRDSIETTYSEGTYICFMRNTEDGQYMIDAYPLGIAEVSGYSQGGKPIILINIAELRQALKDVMLKDKKGKALFFDKLEDAVEASYPVEVYTAFKNRERYAKLDVDHTGTVRINNMGKKYGLTPIFRALPATIMLKGFQGADSASAKSKAKKIIHQKLRKETMGQDYTNLGLEEMAYAHQELMKAFRQSTVVYTSPPQVESILYVEPKTDDIAVDKVSLYRNKVLSSLGVAFLANDKSQTASTANISLKQLMRCINRISEQTERMLEGFYRVVLRDHGIPAEYAPSISIIDSEMLEMDMRMELAGLLYNTFNCSRETTLKLLDVDVDDEKAKRMQENADGLDDIFAPHLTAYTTSGNTDGDSGRPADDDPETQGKRDYDEEYNKTR